MSHNMHNVNGLLLVGIDFHIGFHIFPPMPMAFWKLNLLHPFTLGDKAKPTVLFDGVPAVTHMHSPRFLWPHVGIIPDPLDALTPIQIAFGKQRCFMPRTGVLIENEVATCCVMPGPLSINSDCWTGAMIPSSLILNTGTVVTNPTPEDFALGAMSALLDNSLLGPLLDGALSVWDWFDPAGHRDCNCANGEFPEGEYPRPKGVDIDANIREAMAMRDRPIQERLVWFWAKVQGGGDWDYKKYSEKDIEIPGRKGEIPEFEPFGNYHFGIAGKALGLPEGFLLRGAGAYQMKQGTPGEGGWEAPYGDDKFDQEMIKKGFDYMCCQ